MSCPHCEAMRERIAWLESELGLQNKAHLVEKLRPHITRHNRQCQVAQFFVVLWLARGRPVSNFQLMESIRSPMGVDRDSNIVKVWASKARKALGMDAVNTISGFGYQLTPAGMRKVAEILGEPLEQAA